MTNEVVNKTIYDKIIEKGSLDAKDITNLGKQKAEEARDVIIEEANKDASRIVNNNQRQNQDKVKAMTTNFERLAKREILFKKKDLMDQLFVEAATELQKLSNKDLFNFVVSRLQKETLNGNEVLKVNKKDYNKYLELFSSSKAAKLVELDKLNKALGNKYKLTLSSDDVDIEGGFIVISEHFDINLSFVSILNIVKGANETELANILFSEAK